MTIINDECGDGWVEISGHGSRLQRAIRRLLASDLSDDAEHVLALGIEKFCSGVEEHGPLDLGTRNWTRELLNESMDGWFYLMMLTASRANLGYHEDNQ